MAKNKGGRPIEFNAEVIKKLEEVFAMDGTVLEACFYANITPVTYYNHVKEGNELFNRFQELRQNPVLKARKTITDKLNDPEHAKWYLERKKKLEFSSRNELTGADGKAIEVKTISGMKIIKQDGTGVQDPK